MVSFFEKVLANFAFFSALSGGGAASFWNAYQPKEPMIIKK